MIFWRFFVSTPLEECEKRDVKGLYAKARKGEIQNFYRNFPHLFEVPEHPALSLDTSKIDFGGVGEPFVGACFAKSEVYKNEINMEEYKLSHLKELEAESIHIIREVAAEFENPVMLYSIGKGFLGDGTLG